MNLPEQTIDDSYPRYQAIDERVCARCCKTLSASRPPTYNADNCSCEEVASRTVGDGSPHAQTPMQREPAYHYNDTTHLYSNQALSCASSSATVPCPEGPEHKKINLPVNNNYLPLASSPDLDLNHVQHQRAASFHSALSYPMVRFLRDPEVRQLVYGTEHINTSDSRFLSQEPHMQSSKRAHKGSPWSKPSHGSSESSPSRQESFMSWGIDPATGAGGWVADNGSQYVFQGDACPMVMSGVMEYSVFDDEMN